MFYENALAWQQVVNARAAVLQHSKDGHWFAALIAANPKVAQRFSDHDEVAEKLRQAGEIDVLASLITSGLLDAESSRPYRLAYRSLVAH